MKMDGENFMTKFIKKAASSLLAALTIGSIATIPLFAGERVIDTPYEYPIVPGTSE